MRLERYLEERDDNIGRFVDAFDRLVNATKEYGKTVDAVLEKSTEKTEQAAELAFHERTDAAEAVIKVLENIVGVRRFVVDEE